MSEDRSARDLMPEAAGQFTGLVHDVAPDAWSRPTPDTEWNVRDLVNHLTAEHLWVPHLLRGETIAQVGDRYDGDVLGDDPVDAWDSAIAESLQAWHEVRSDDDLVELSMGPTPVREYAEQMLTDLTVHAWDLARGAGLPERLHPALVEHVLAYVEPHADSYASSGLFADPVPTESDDPQVRLLALLGRAM